MEKFFTKKIIISLTFLFVIFLALIIYLTPHPKADVLVPSFKSFSIKVPDGYARDDKYKYEELGPSKDISGIKFTIPASMALGTNLSPDSYISVEEIPQVQICSAFLFLNQSTAQIVTDGSKTYSMAFSAGAAAGNRYDETVYAIPESRPCLAIRYFIHYGVYENYPPGTVKQFDEKALLNQFDQIRRTLLLK